MVNVGKYTSPMDGMGQDAVKKHDLLRFFCIEHLRTCSSPKYCKRKPLKKTNVISTLGPVVSSCDDKTSHSATI